MPEHIAGKTFYTEEEARAAGMPVLSEEEKAAAIAQFEDWDKNVRSKAGPGPAPVGGRFSDDMAGTEYDPDAPGYPDHMRKDPGR